MLLVFDTRDFGGLDPSKLFGPDPGCLDTQTSVVDGIFELVATKEVGPFKNFESNGDGTANRCQLTILTFGYLTGSHLSSWRYSPSSQHPSTPSKSTGNAHHHGC